MSDFFEFNEVDEPIKQLIQQLVSTLSPDDLVDLFSKAKIQTISKKETYINIHAKPNTIGFVTKGVFRCVYEKEGKEITGGFFLEGDIVCSYSTLLAEKPSPYRIEAIEDSSIIEINNHTLGDLYIQNSSLAEWGRKFLKQELGKLIERMERHFLDSPEERYIKLLEENREIFSRVPQKYIASFLGITDVSLSRMRARVLKKN